MQINITPELKRVAFVGNYLPRKCGIATFTSDLADSFSEQFPEIHTLTLAMNDTDEGYSYPAQVRYEIAQDDRLDYERAASFLNQQTVDIISLQHEYGIYGGQAGSHILTFLRKVTAPVVTTLHTILENPQPEQHRVLEEIIGLSNRLVVMSQRSIRLLKDVYGAPVEKIDLIPHGIHDVPFVDPGFHKDKFGAEGKFVILTFGLLSRNKGLEYVIEALPRVVERYPNLVYVILGSTHPHVLLHEGEEYRESLQERIRELGLEEHVIFKDEFVHLKDLKEYIGAADIYITPYLGREQIVSGTLAYTVGAGKAVISTPYRYAEELLADGRGLIVPFMDSKSIGEKILFLLDNEAERNAIRKRAYMYGRDMIWPSVAEKYLSSFEQARRQNVSQLFAIPVASIARERFQETPALKLDHLQRMTDGTGMLQHAVFSVPNYDEGYTTDDNARALIVTVQLEDIEASAQGSPDQAALQRSRELATRYLAFLWHAFNPENKHFRNFTSPLQRELGSGWNVQIGMRYGSPSISEALARLRADGVEEIVYAPLFPQFAEATTGSANEELRVQLRKMNWSPEVRFLPPFHAHDGFLRDQAALIRPYLKEADHVVFSFHGLPESHVRKVEGCLAEGCCERKNACELNCYKAQSLRTARDLANRLELPADRWSLGFQSRLGRAKWIGPSTDDVLKNLAVKGVERLVVACPSFVTDCLETLEEIGLGANQDFIRAGGKDFRLAPCLNADPAWTKSLAALVGAIR